ncbi:MAG: diacylglycerol kinase family protein, partial [Oscillospiraceae bacterium]
FCMKSERNMRIHTVAAVYILFFAPFLQVSRGEFAILLAVIAAMLTSEAFNTAIEKLCDYTCRNQNRFIGTIKDISAGAVFISALFAVGIGLVVLCKPIELWALIRNIAGSPLYILALVFSFCAALVYIIKGPLGIKRGFHRLFNKTE